jgi:magnesium transporter
VGARPGTLLIRPDALSTRIKAIVYEGEGCYEAELEDESELRAVLARPGKKWIEVEGLRDEAKLRFVAAAFGMHPLALEDAVNVPHRPKSDAYDEHQLYIARMVLPGENCRCQSEQVTVLFNRSWVLTFQERYADVLDPVRKRLRHPQGQMRRQSADYLAYAIIDAIIDGYYPILEAIGDELEDLEDQVLGRPNSATLGKINSIRRDLIAIRRGIWPQRDAITTLLFTESKFVSKPVVTYFRGAYDHCVQIADLVETYRELAGVLLNTYLSAIANRTNEIMKVLTILSSIFIPLTFLVGVYGMNFTHMPEIEMEYAYPVLVLVMIVISIAQVIYFKRKGWIGGGKADG